MSEDERGHPYEEKLDKGNPQITCCESLHEALDRQDRKKPRLVIHDVTGIRGEKKGKVRQAVVLYSGDFRRGGVEINFCPFCGVAIRGNRRVWIVTRSGSSSERGGPIAAHADEQSARAHVKLGEAAELGPYTIQAVPINMEPDEAVKLAVPEPLPF